MRKSICLVALVVGVAIGAPTQIALGQQASGDLTLGTSQMLTLGDLRDMGLCINQIQQQAKNIYLEVTRKPVPRTAEPHFEDLKAISKGSIDPSAAVYQPVRQEWLTYYVGTMEPMIYLLKANLDATRSGASTLMVPKSTVDEFTTMLTNYDLAIKAMNQNLDVIHEKMSDPHGNVAIAHEAVKLYETTQELEKARHRAFNLVKKADRKGEEREALPTP
jgi:hypothetical protein